MQQAQTTAERPKAALTNAERQARWREKRDSEAAMGKMAMALFQKPTKKSLKSQVAKYLDQAEDREAAAAELRMELVELLGRGNH